MRKNKLLIKQKSELNYWDQISFLLKDYCTASDGFT